MGVVVTEVAERLLAQPHVFGEGPDPTLSDRSTGSVVRASDNTHIETPLIGTDNKATVAGLPVRSPMVTLAAHDLLESSGCEHPREAAEL